MDLESIPGVGTKTADALRALDDAEEALARGDVAALAQAPGISAGRAARLARAAIRDRHDDPGDFLQTDAARRVYRAILDRLKDRAVTDSASARLETFYPSAVPSRIEETQAITRRALEREPTEALRDALRDLAPVRPPRDVRVRDRCLATTDAEVYARARERVPEISVEIVEDARGLADLARGYSTVIALDESFAGIDVDGDIRIEPEALADPTAVVPERTLAFYATNRDRIRAAVRVHREADLDPPDALDVDLETLAVHLDRITSDGGIAGDEELDRLEAAVSGLDGALDDAENIADQRLRAAIQERDVTIEGTDLLSLVERGAGVDSLLGRELADEYAEAVEAAREHLVESLDLRHEEVDHATRCFPDEPTYPVERESDAVTRLRETLTAARDRRTGEHKRELAAELAEARPGTESLVRQALDLDVELAIARFAQDFECSMPTIDGEGIDLVEGRSPLLDVPFPAVEPVDYDVAGVTLLSGVNSGGKTSLLDLLAAVVILAHMGLPVPAASARVGRFDALYYQAKSQGTLDAGAFEATLREFADVASGEGHRLVLVDELESITEPGASARIIAGILETLAEEDATAVFVSHLAAEIIDAAEIDIRVDGIEALGLEDGELQVNRSPVPNHLARSTPELIVEKLATEGGTDRDFYDRLLRKFD